MLGPVIPKGVDYKKLEEINELMTKLMKKYIDKVQAEPTLYVQRQKMIDRLCGFQPVAKDFPVFYVDSHLPSFPKIFLYGLDFDFLMLQVLVITAMDRAKFIGNNGI